jgi:hypothetical protein
MSRCLTIGTPPIIIIGMHRSGTSLISRLLERLGLFMGKRKDANSEALFFQSLNRWIFRIAGATWDQPSSLDRVLESAEWRELILTHLERHLLSGEIRSYLGWRMRMRYGGLAHLNVPWGWKDPRNTYTLPLWLEFFPDAKIIHVQRNGVDVAESLRKRHVTMLEQLHQGKSQRHRGKKQLLLVAEEHFDAAGFRCASLEEGFVLWQQYISRAQVHTQLLGARALEIDFESFLTAPQTSIKKLAAFCQLEYNSAMVEALSAQMDSSRAYAYRTSDRLKTFALSAEARLLPRRGN